MPRVVYAYIIFHTHAERRLVADAFGNSLYTILARGANTKHAPHATVSSNDVVYVYAIRAD